VLPQIALPDLFSELVALLVVSAAAGAAAIRLRQPVLVGFIIAGIIVGPSGLNWVRAADQIHVMAEMGLTLLLFVVGLKLDPRLIRSMGSVALTAGGWQVVLTALASLGLSLVLGIASPSALYAALALTLSSTIIIIKLLSDKREMDSLHGRITLGILIVQDVVVILAMIGLSASVGGASDHPMMQVLGLLARGAALLAGIALMVLIVFPRVLPLLARSTELLVLAGIVWALLLAALAGHLGFSIEVGAFLAGVALASTEYRESMAARLISVRDFLLLFFFVELGSSVDLKVLGAQVLPAIPLSLFVLVGKPLLVMLIMRVMGYRARTGFMTGLAVSQISEFSLILVAMGAKAGHITADAVGMVTVVALITISISSYLILYSHELYECLSPHLHLFERKTAHREDGGVPMELHGPPVDVVVFGLGRYGTGIVDHLEARGRTVLGVDFDPQVVKEWNARGRLAVYGDGEDPEFATMLPLSSARWVVSSVRDPRVNRYIVHALRHAGFSGNIAVAADQRDTIEFGDDDSSRIVLAPFEDAAKQAVDLLMEAEERIAREAMQKLIHAISEHYIICGFGRMGQQICKDLARQGVAHVVVEDNPEQLPRLREKAIPHVEGKATDDETLLAAGIQRAKGLIAVAASDQENVFIVLTARGLNPDLFIVARSILEENEVKLRRAGADRVISPYILGGRRIAAVITRRGVMDFLDLVLHGDEVETDIAHLVVPQGSPRANTALAELELWRQCGVTVLATQDPGCPLVANPSPDTLLREGTELIAMGTPAQLHRAQRILSGAL
jgi:Kef-type K+ transport system membrane component KefB/Trk K+ transport system NAD-binding subunit